MSDSESSAERAILFADIVDSSRLYQKLGDERAQNLISEGVTLMKDIVEQYNGVFIKSIGDEILAEYESAAQAVESAIFMIRMLRNMADSENEVWSNLHIKIGIHFGPVVEKDNDVFGNSVNIAARIVSEAKDSQILVTEAVIAVIDSDVTTRFVESAELKGIKEPVNIHEVLFTEGEVSGHTSILSDDLFEEFQTEQALNNRQAKLTILVSGNEYTVNADKDRLKFGRNPDNDVVIDRDGVSRYHCKIEFKKGKFVLNDESSNGSFVVLENGDKKHIRRAEFTLDQKCRIGLGQPPVEGSTHTLEINL